MGLLKTAMYSGNLSCGTCIETSRLFRSTGITQLSVALRKTPSSLHSLRLPASRRFQPALAATCFLVSERFLHPSPLLVSDVCRGHQAGFSRTTFSNSGPVGHEVLSQLEPSSLSQHDPYISVSPPRRSITAPPAQQLPRPSVLAAAVVAAGAPKEAIALSGATAVAELGAAASYTRGGMHDGERTILLREFVQVRRTTRFRAAPRPPST